MAQAHQFHASRATISRGSAAIASSILRSVSACCGLRPRLAVQSDWQADVAQQLQLPGQALRRRRQSALVAVAALQASPGRTRLHDPGGHRNVRLLGDLADELCQLRARRQPDLRQAELGKCLVRRGDCGRGSGQVFGCGFQDVRAVYWACGGGLFRLSFW